jgi:glycosyltransferase involved in cell wall biosynthesis
MFTDAYWPRINGVTVSVDSFSHALVRSGNEVMIICSLYPESEEAERITAGKSRTRETEHGEPIVIRVPSMPLIISKEDRIAKFSKWFWVSKQIEAFNPDIIHVNTEFVIAEFGFQYAKLHNLPVIYTFHTLWEDYVANYIPLIPTFMLRAIIRSIHKNILRRAGVIIAPTVQIQEVLRKYKIKKQSYLLPTGIDPHVFSPEPAEIAQFRAIITQQYPQLINKRVLLFAGRIAKEKNIDFLLKIVPEVTAKHPEVVFLFVGNGPDLYFYTEECERLGIQEQCVFTGYAAREDLALIYGMSDIFVFPSLTETQGLVTIEAMLSGTPVVAIGVMGTIQVMNGNKGGFMVQNDAGEFIARVFDLLEDDELYRRKVEEAKRHAQGWTIGTMTAKLEQIYRSSLRTFRQTHPQTGRAQKFRGA